MSLASLFLSSVSLKNADIKCLMLACTTDVQIKTSPVRRVFFFSFFLYFDNTFVVSAVSRFDSSLPFPPFLKVWIVFHLFLCSLSNQKVAGIEERKKAEKFAHMTLGINVFQSNASRFFFDVGGGGGFAA